MLNYIASNMPMQGEILHMRRRV